MFSLGVELLSRYNVQQQLVCLGRGRNIMDDANELIVSFFIKGQGVYRYRGALLREITFLISFVLTTEAEGSRSSCSVSATY